MYKKIASFHIYTPTACLAVFSITNTKQHTMGKKEGWKSCQAKRILAQDIIDGTVKEDTPWTEVFHSRPEYEATEERLFKGRLDRLRKAVGSAEHRATRDKQALEHDRKIHPIQTHDHRGEPRWEGSAAQSWLQIDVRAGLHRSMAPKLFHASRTAYLEFSLEVFRGHIHQEERTQKYHRWRNDAKKPKATDWI